MFEVINKFRDLEDENHIYEVGDIYPRKVDAQLDDKRIKQLISKNNLLKKPLIQKIKTKESTKDE